jgi:hypothetical protein
MLSQYNIFKLLQVAGYRAPPRINKLFGPLAAGVFLWVSCAGDPGVQQESFINRQKNDLTRQAQNLSSRSLEEIYDSGYWVTRPENSSITVIGIAGRRSNRDEAITEALADAARKAGLYHGVHGESALVLNQGTGNLDYFADFDYCLRLLTDTDLYIHDLVFDKDSDVLEKNGAVYVRSRYPGVSGIPPYHSVMEDGVPDWVKNMGTDVPGFLTGIGFSKNRGSPQKTYQVSYENAIISLLPRLSTMITGEVVDVEGDKVTRNVSISKGDLTDVMILETWVDKKIGAVWTLLVAKQRF